MKNTHSFSLTAKADSLRLVAIKSIAIVNLRHYFG
jgi:hypothetical protein